MALMILGFAVIALTDLIPLIRQRSARDIFAFLLIFLMALTLATLQMVRVEVPSIMMLLGNAVKALGLSY
jgi:hypothetical protein